MPAEIDALLGNDPKLRMQLLSDQLARQQKLGLAGVISGDRAMGQAGAGMYNSANDASKNVANDYLNNLYRKYQEDLSNWQQKDAGAERLWRSRENDLDRKNTLDAANVRADSRPTRPIPMGDRNKMTVTTQTLGGLNSLLSYVNKVSEKKVDLGNPGGVWKARSALNWAAGGTGIGELIKKLGPEGANNIAEFWRAVDNIYNLPQRNAMFGAALTPSEQALWDKAAPGPGMTMEDLQASLSVMQQIVQNKYDEMNDNLTTSYGEEATAGFRPEKGQVSLPLMDKLLGGEVVSPESQVGGAPSLITRGSAQPARMALPKASAAQPGRVPRYKVVIGPDGQPMIQQ